MKEGNKGMEGGRRVMSATKGCMTRARKKKGKRSKIAKFSALWFVYENAFRKGRHFTIP